LYLLFKLLLLQLVLLLLDELLLTLSATSKTTLELLLKWRNFFIEGIVSSRLNAGH